jgi:hypothetical protein
VALNDIFYIIRPNENVHFFNKFFRKHVDFLLCEPEKFKPAIGVELVKPVGRSAMREPDQFVVKRAEERWRWGLGGNRLRCGNAR